MYFAIMKNRYGFSMLNMIVGTMLLMKLVLWRNFGLLNSYPDLVCRKH